MALLCPHLLRENWYSSLGPAPAFTWESDTSCVSISKQTKKGTGASLVAHWKRIRLPMQKTRVQSLVWEDPSCHRTTKPVCHNYWACAPESGTATREAPEKRSLCSTTERGPRSPQLKKSLCSNEIQHSQINNKQCFKKVLINHLLILN